MEHKGTIELKTRRLTLRRFEEGDTPTAFRNWTSDEEVTRFLRWPPHKDPAETQAILNSWIAAYEKPDFYQWAIVPHDLNEPIGSISVVEQDERTAKIHIGYCIGQCWWHRGYTSEAFAAVISFFFEQVGANRLESQHDPENPHSGAVMRKCGLRCEGTLRSADWSNRGLVDACMYSILSKEYFGQI